MFDKHHKKESPTFTGITRGVGGFGFGAGGGDSEISGVSDNYWFATLGDSSNTSKAYGVAVDSVGNIYVTGKTAVGSGKDKALTAKYNTNGVIQWQRTISSGDSSGDNDEGRDIVIDNSGDIIVVGKYTNQKGFIAKYNTSGELQWANSYSSITYHYKVDFDNDGNIYTANEGNSALYISKFNSSGDHQWSRDLQTSNGGSSEAYDVKIDRENNQLYVVGRARAFSGNTSGSDYEGVLAKYSLQGSLTFAKAWNTSAGSSRTVWATSVAINSSGNVFAFGWGEQGGTGSNYRDLFYSRFNSAGNNLNPPDLAFKMGTNIAEYPNHAICDSSDKVYIVGSIGSFGPGLLLKYEGDGAGSFGGTSKIYSRQLSASQTVLYGVSVDNENKAVYIVGYTNRSGQGGIDFIIGKVPVDGSMTDSSYDSGNLSYVETNHTTTSATFSATYVNAKSPSGTMSSSNAGGRVAYDILSSEGVGSLTSAITPMA